MQVNLMLDTSNPVDLATLQSIFGGVAATINTSVAPAAKPVKEKPAKEAEKEKPAETTPAKDMLEQIRAAWTQKKDADVPVTKLTALLAEYGCKKLTDLPATAHAEFLTKVQAF